MTPKIIKIDPYLAPYENDLNARINNYKAKKQELVGDGSLSDFANGYNYFGFHKVDNGWVYREWAPAADRMFLTGDFNGWDIYKNQMARLDNGVFEIFIGDELKEGSKVQAIVEKNGNILRRVPSYATRVVQDDVTYLWTAEVYEPTNPFLWEDGKFKMPRTPFIYECHIGMAQDKYGIGTYVEFADNILPRIKKLGYNTIQIMAIMEHPYYGSFGYQVSNFFAPSSRFGTADDLK